MTGSVQGSSEDSAAPVIAPAIAAMVTVSRPKFAAKVTDRSRSPSASEQQGQRERANSSWPRSSVRATKMLLPA